MVDLLIHHNLLCPSVLFMIFAPRLEVVIDHFFYVAVVFGFEDWIVG